MQIDINQLISAFRLSPAIKLLEEKDRNVLMELIQAGDQSTIDQISAILEQEKEQDTVLNAVAQQVVHDTVKKLLQLDKIKSMHEAESRSKLEDEEKIAQEINNLNKL